MRTLPTLRGLVLALSCFPSLALAQNAPGEDDVAQLQTVIVTAQKRAENIQTVPVAVTAIGNEELLEQQVTSLRDIVQLAPSLNFSQSNGVTESYAVRGIGSENATSLALQDSVATILDGVAIQNPFPLREDFSDVQRVEVLRGPQGLLFGQAASAGVIQVITIKPVLNQFGVQSHLSVGNADEYSEGVAEGAVNLPVGDDLAIRLTAYYHKRTGDVLNVYDDRRLNGIEERGGKFKLLWEPSDRLSVYVTADETHQDVPIGETVPYLINPGPLLTYYQSYGIQPGLDNQKDVLDGPIYGTRTMGGLMGEIDYRFDGATLTSITGYRYAAFSGNLDLDGTAKNQFDFNTAVDASHQYSEDLRLASSRPAFGIMDYVTGLYVNRYDDHPSDNVGLLAGLANFTFYGPNEFTAYALYGQATFHVSDRWRIISGARAEYDHNDLSYWLVNTGALPSGVLGFPAISIDVPEHKLGTMAKIGVEHDFDATTMGYVTFTKGYKGPGYNTQELQNASHAAVGAEDPLASEIGLKATVARNTQLDLAIFDTEFLDYQATVDVNTPLGVQSLIQNAGKLTSRGVELEFRSHPFRYFQASGGVTYQRAKYVDLPNQDCYVGQTAQTGCINGETSASGRNLANAPNVLLTVQGMYTRPITSRVDGFIGADYYWRSWTNFSPVGDPREAIGSYGLLGASVGLTGADGKWTVTAWVKNLLDKRFVSAINGIGNFADPSNLQIYKDPEAYREAGLSLDLSL